MVQRKEPPLSVFWKHFPLLTNKLLEAIYVHSHVYQFWRQTSDIAACYINPHAEHVAIYLSRSGQAPKPDLSLDYSTKYFYLSFHWSGSQCRNHTTTDKWAGDYYGGRIYLPFLLSSCFSRSIECSRQNIYSAETITASHYCQRERSSWVVMWEIRYTSIMLMIGNTCYLTAGLDTWILEIRR